MVVGGVIHVPLKFRRFIVIQLSNNTIRWEFWIVAQMRRNISNFYPVDVTIY